MAETFWMVARELGWDVAETKNMTGHALRAWLGVELNITKFSSFVDGAATPYFVTSEMHPWTISHALERSSLQEVLCQTALVVNLSRKEISEPDIERIVLDAQSSDTLRLVDEKKEEILRMVVPLKTQKIVMDDRWAGELSGRFLPKFVVNHKSHKIHAVRDAMCTGCGFEWRNSKAPSCLGHERSIAAKASVTHWKRLGGRAVNCKSWKLVE